MEVQTFNNLESELPLLRRDENEGYVYAGFWIRAVAFFIDSMALNILMLPLIFINGFLQYYGENNLLVLGLTKAIYYFLYFYITVWFISTKGGLPGKMLLGLKIVNSETGLFLTPGKIIKREVLGKVLSVFLLFGGFIMVGFRKDKKGLHDLISNSQVLRKQSRA